MRVSQIFCLELPVDLTPAATLSIGKHQLATRILPPTVNSTTRSNFNFKIQSQERGRENLQYQFNLLDLATQEQCRGNRRIEI